MCVQKMDKGLTGLEWHECELLMAAFSFLGELTLVQMLQFNFTDKMGKWVPKMSENLFI